MSRPKHHGHRSVGAHAAGLIVLVLLGLLFLDGRLSSRPAWADPGSVPADACEPLGSAAPPEKCGERSTPSSGNSQRSGLMDRVIGVDQAEGPGIDHYDIGYDEGGTFSIQRKVVGYLTELAFALARWLLRIGLWLVDWALQFRFAEALAAPAAAVADRYQLAVVDRLGLGSLALFAAAAWAGWHALRGRLSRGAGEFGMSLAVAAVTAVSFAAPASVLLGDTGLLGRTRDLSLEVAATAMSEDGASTSAAGAATVTTNPLTKGLRHAFVELPHQLLDWGRVLEDVDGDGPERAHPCLPTYLELVTTGPHGVDDEPRTAMKDSGCTDLADFNHDPSSDRLMAAVLVLVAVFFVMVLLCAVAGTLVAAQLSTAVLVMLAPFALAGGLLPGAGRQLLWRWLMAVARALAAVVMTAVFLALFLVTIEALLSATAGQPLMVQMGVLDLLVVCSFLARSRLLRSGRRIVSNAGRRLETMRIGGSRNGVMGAAAADAPGLPFARMWAENRAELRHMRALGPHRRPGGARGHAARHRLGAPSPAGPGAVPSKGWSKAEGHPGTAAGRAAVTGIRLAKGAAKVALASTVGAPVYVPRATKRAKSVAVARVAAMRGNAAQAITDRQRRAQSFGREYVANVRTAVSAPAAGYRSVAAVTRRLAERAAAGRAGEDDG